MIIPVRDLGDIDWGEVVFTRQDVGRILKAHSLEFCSTTAWWESGDAVDGSTFDHQVGVKETYTAEEVRNWLGY